MRKCIKKQISNLIEKIQYVGNLSKKKFFKKQFKISLIIQNTKHILYITVKLKNRKDFNYKMIISNHLNYLIL